MQETAWIDLINLSPRIAMQAMADVIKEKGGSPTKTLGLSNEVLNLALKKCTEPDSLSVLTDACLLGGNAELNRMMAQSYVRNEVSQPLWSRQWLRGSSQSQRAIRYEIIKIWMEERAVNLKHGDSWWLTGTAAETETWKELCIRDGELMALAFMQQKGMELPETKSKSQLAIRAQEIVKSEGLQFMPALFIYSAPLDIVKKTLENCIERGVSSLDIFIEMDSEKMSDKRWEALCEICGSAIEREEKQGMYLSRVVDKALSAGAPLHALSKLVHSAGFSGGIDLFSLFVATRSNEKKGSLLVDMNPFSSWREATKIPMKQMLSDVEISWRSLGLEIGDEVSESRKAKELLVLSDINRCAGESDALKHVMLENVLCAMSSNIPSKSSHKKRL